MILKRPSLDAETIILIMMKETEVFLKSVCTLVRKHAVSEVRYFFLLDLDFLRDEQTASEIDLPHCIGKDICLSQVS